METKRIETIKTSMKVGAVLGGMVFLLFGLMPGFHFGSAGVIMLLSKIIGGPVEATLAVRMLLVGGALLGITCLAMLSIVLGSVFGTVSGYAITALSPANAPEAENEMI